MCVGVCVGACVYVSRGGIYVGVGCVPGRMCRMCGACVDVCCDVYVRVGCM